MKDIAYLRPQILQEASDYLLAYPHAKLLAGGTDLILSLERKKVTPTHIVDLSGISHLNQVVFENGILRLGAMVTIQELHEVPIVRDKFPDIAVAAGHLGCWQVRNRATLGGNLANAAPSAEMAPPLIAHNAKVKLVSSQGERMLPLEEFFTGPGRTIMHQGEVLAEIIVPEPREGLEMRYSRHALRRSMDISVVNVVVHLQLKGEIVIDVKIVLGAVAPTPIRSKRAEEILVGKKLDNILISNAAQAASLECQPITDVRATAGYRRKMVQVLTERALYSFFKGGAALES